MALASQSTRTQEVARGSKNNYQSPRRKKKQRMMIAIIAALVVVGGGYAGYHQLTKKPKTPQTPDQNNQASNPQGPSRPTDGAKPTTNVPVPITEPPAHKPDELTMGAKKTEEQPKAAPTEPVIDPLAKPTDALKGEAPGTTPTSAPSPAPAPAPAPSPASIDDMPADAATAMDRAKRAMGENKLVEARGLLNNVLANSRVKESEKEGIRSWLGEINQTLVFSPTVAPNDPLAESYKVASGDNLQNITRKRGLAVDRRLIARVNRMANPDMLRLGQSLKLVHGPFHAVVHKSRYRLDLYAGTPLPPGSAGTPRADGSEEGWTFIKSFQVGLGENNGTPLGTFVVKKDSKLVNPHWVNPRTGERFTAEDPKNPIGEHWLGLTGVDEKTKSITGYGLHGTIDPASIGNDRSMGCVRMRSEDIAVVWEMLVDEVSTLRIAQ